MNKAAIEDYELVQMCCACDHPSKEEFIKRYTGLVYHVYLNKCAGVSGYDREDFAHYAWLHLFDNNGRRLRMYRPEARFSTWFSIVLARLCVDLIRKQAPGPLLEETPLLVPNDFDRVELKILFEQLSRILSLEEKFLFKLYINDVSTQKIMEETGIKSEEEVHKKVFNVKNKLQREAIAKGVIQDD